MLLDWNGIRDGCKAAWAFLQAHKATGYGLDFSEIAVVTTLLILRDLTNKNRPFDWSSIIRTWPFAWLFVIQAGIAYGALSLLVNFQRAQFGGTDAWWVALAGLSILKAFPAKGGQNQNGAQLENLMEWVLQKFYGDLRLQINSNSRQFANWLITTYSGKASAADFLQDTVDFVDATEDAASASTDKQTITSSFILQADDPTKVRYLANWVAPRTTRKRWKRLNRK